MGALGTLYENPEQGRCWRRVGEVEVANYAFFRTGRSRSPNLRVFALLLERFAPTTEISLIDGEDSSGEIIFESVHIYPEIKYLKE